MPHKIPMWSSAKVVYAHATLYGSVVAHKPGNKYDVLVYVTVVGSKATEATYTQIDVPAHRIAGLVAANVPANIAEMLYD